MVKPENVLLSSEGRIRLADDIATDSRFASEIEFVLIFEGHLID